ncbi:MULTISPECIES: hypothetical protein [unclassified Bradyrhizobium]
MARRVVLGKYADGVNYGLRVSLPGTDAYLGNSNAGGFSFDSNWTDIVQTLMVGTSTTASLPSWPNQGYTPYVEVRQISGSVVFDDGVYASGHQVGIAATVLPTGISSVRNVGTISILYAVFKLPVLSG